jgi:hypothetical protein
MRLYRNGAMPKNAVCHACGERRQALLKPARLEGTIVLCGNCCLVLAKTRPTITTVAELRRRAARERRAGADRRSAPRGGRRHSDRLAATAFDPSID